MKRLCRCSGITLLIAMMITGAAIAGETATIEGKVNDDYQVITDDRKVYELSADDEHEAVWDRLTEEIGKKVKVKGIIETDDQNLKVINVLSYELVEVNGIEQ